MRLVLPFPPTSNNLFDNRKGGRRRTSEYTVWLSQAGYELKMQKPPQFEVRVAVDIALRNPNNVRRDLDNRIKPVLDLLVKHQVIPADDHRVVRALSARWVDEGEMCVVTVTPISETQEEVFQRLLPKLFAGLAVKGDAA